MSTAPFEWLAEAGTVWHSVQATGVERHRVPVRWAWWAPTARVVVAVSPLVPAGGAAKSGAACVAVWAAFPWQVVQVIGMTSTVPLMCVAALTVVAVYPVWQEPQAVFWECGAGGGAPWQEVQVLACEGPPVQD